MIISLCSNMHLNMQKGILYNLRRLKIMKCRCSTVPRISKYLFHFRGFMSSNYKLLGKVLGDQFWEDGQESSLAMSDISVDTIHSWQPTAVLCPKQYSTLPYLFSSLLVPPLYSKLHGAGTMALWLTMVSSTPTSHRA